LAYFSVLILVLIITVSGLAFVRLSQLEDRLFLEESRSHRALAAAEGGVRRVAWALRSLPALKALHPGARLNPFNSQWYADPAAPWKDADLMDLVNPWAGESFHPDARGEYYWIASLSAAGTKVRLRLLGAVDLDGDGLVGLGDRDGDGYPDLADADPQDTNRFVEVYLGLPGSLGEDLAMAAQDVVDAAGASVSLAWSGSGLRTTKNHDLAGFWYDRTETWQGWTRYGTVLSKPILRGLPGADDVPGGLRLPPGLFKADGTPDPAYFWGLPVRYYDGTQTFDPTRDPTAGTTPGTVIWVNGDVIVRELDLGTVVAGGGVSGGHWVGSDVILVSTGKITLEEVSCGWAGRLILLAKEIDLTGSWGRWVNGVAVASGDIRLLSTLPPASQWVHVPPGPRPAWPANYFYGSMAAGGKIQLAQGGWALIFDRLTLNGILGQAPGTALLDAMEGEGLAPCWVVAGEVTQAAQGRYLEDEVNHGAGGSLLDAGGDGVPELLKATVSPSIADTGQGEGVRLVLDGSVPGCTPIQADWSRHSELRFHVAVDNYRRTADLGGGALLTTEREARFRLLFRDGANPPNELVYELTVDDDPTFTREKYLLPQWGTAPYVLSGGDVQDPDPVQDDYASGDLPRWKLVRLTFSALRDAGGALPLGFDFANLRDVGFFLQDVTLRWRMETGGVTELRELRAAGGQLRFDSDGAGPQAPVEITEAGDGRFQYQDPSSGTVLDVPCDVGGDCWGVGPIRATDLVTSLRVDHLLLPGGWPLDYGLPSGFCVEASGWREITEQEALR
jgi:hypothetical protein